ncbi:hypothetical protein SAMN05660909_00647 [Chitinophaga terrae (ex Kim and Jung 2007)]|jgi:hypothetical protein|uniref:6-phosphogluconate dehydrogenase n=1 Tax=Chitinophaga terrae (ex Kim and Jung 2007) TaxID=408074 RepID=A0A1H3Y228_9BACT|nr:hypothetical protein [Chitinophaga terrae (ex Kim and Jung 2007)]MDQ0108054.1 hypothetical protein [Chitinophaga terrae (ex Kim and Jung 2007)]GEP89540.1 hypothetical protein CTE07_11850 [Chitinophaga terrae (ex Kim and Jung 2007)]SEA05709.1 hypothetical protein SAMN05660909_00647 [Chitinophaga terrae (ex Kim and Jung 2007)]
MGRFLFIVILVIVVLLGGGFFYKFYFVFGKGVKAGELNYFVQKGYIFKTYEGKLIQSGYRGKVAGTIQSNEFEFSVTDERVAQRLMNASGKAVELHYKEYLGAIPWRGFSPFIVDSIISIRDANTGAQIP